VLPDGTHPMPSHPSVALDRGIDVPVAMELFPL
jgi:hypothetical protein